MLIAITILFFFLLFTGSQIPFATAIAAMPYLIKQNAGITIPQKIFTANDSFSLLAVPFFMLAGAIMEEVGITEGIVRFANSLVGHIKGGMAHTVSLAGVMMAGISGSANADASALGTLLLPTMKKAGYDPGYSVACIASAAGLGPIIPPSIFMVIYASITGFAPGRLFMGGIIPGLMLACGYITINYFYAKRAGIPTSKFKGWGNVWKEFKVAVWALLMPVIIVGGILGGVFTATEAGVVAACYGFAYGLITRKLGKSGLWHCFRRAALSTASPMFIILTASILSYAVNMLGLSKMMETFCVNYVSNKWGFYLFIIAILLVAGCLIDGNATMLMLVPVFKPVAAALGLPELQFAVIFVTMLTLGGITPPVGMYLFIVSSVDGTPLNKCLRWVIPFVIVNLVVVLLMVAFEPLTVWLPSFAK